ncbi:MAG TPA: sulfite exporter TauE/SafE family protein [Flavobacteriales bacterium]|nr:sulfite exporter TauE/SafE family protein [Flavobacteriales bacterium]
MTFEPILFFLLLFVAEVLGTIGGFGSSMLVMPLASLFMPFDQALGLTALFHLFSNAAKIMLFRDGVSRHLLLWLGVPAVIGVLVGARLTVRFDERMLSLILGGLLVAMGALMLIRSEWKLKATKGNAIWGGALSGAIAGLAGTGGAVRGITLAAFGLSKNAFVSTSAWIDMGVDLSRSVVYASQGFMTATVLAYLPAMAVASFGGSWVGKRLLARIAQDDFRRIVLGLVVAMGAVSIWRALLAA